MSPFTFRKLHQKERTVHRNTPNKMSYLMDVSIKNYKHDSNV